MYRPIFVKTLTIVLLILTFLDINGTSGLFEPTKEKNEINKLHEFGEFGKTIKPYEQALFIGILKDQIDSLKNKLLAYFFSIHIRSKLIKLSSFTHSSSGLSPPQV